MRGRIFLYSGYARFCEMLFAYAAQSSARCLFPLAFVSHSWAISSLVRSPLAVPPSARDSASARSLIARWCVLTWLSWIALFSAGVSGRRFAPYFSNAGCTLSYSFGSLFDPRSCISANKTTDTYRLTRVACSECCPCGRLKTYLGYPLLRHW